MFPYAAVSPGAGLPLVREGRPFAVAGNATVSRQAGERAPGVRVLAPLLGRLGLGRDLHTSLLDLLVRSCFEILQDLAEQEECRRPKADENGKALGSRLSLLI